MATRKKFIQVEVPLINEVIEVLGTPETLHKKSIKLDLSRKLKGKNLEITFKIFNQDNELAAFPKKMLISRSYISRAVRKGTSYVEDSLKIKAKDIRLTIKPLLVTRKKVSRVVRKNLRNTAKEFLIEYTKEKNYLDICEESLSGELQQKLLPKLKKVYPLSFCDIRILETKELEKADLGKPKQKPKEETEKPVEKDKEKKEPKPEKEKPEKKEIKKKTKEPKTKTPTKTKKEPKPKK